MTDIERIKKLAKHWHGLATSVQRAAGAVWYPDALRFCAELADTHRTDVKIVAGVVAALSPAVYWDLNKRQAEALVQAYACGGMESARDVVLSTYGQQAEKAYRILQLEHGKYLESDITDILGPKAWKTKAFFRNMLGKCPSVCIDRHMVSALRFTDRWTSAHWCYRLLAKAVNLAAQDLGIDSATLQATIWITYKDTADAYSAAEQGVQHDVRTRGQDARDLPV